MNATAADFSWRTPTSLTYARNSVAKLNVTVQRWWSTKKLTQIYSLSLDNHSGSKEACCLYPFCMVVGQSVGRLDPGKLFMWTCIDLAVLALPLLYPYYRLSPSADVIVWWWSPGLQRTGLWRVPFGIAVFSGHLTFLAVLVLHSNFRAVAFRRILHFL